MGNKFFSGAVSFLALFWLSPARCGEPGPCSLDDAAPVEIAAIDEDFDILTDDGRRIALVGLEFPSPTRSDPKLRDRSLARLSARLAEARPVFLALTSGLPDRWGRLPGGLFFAGEGRDAPLVSVGEALLRAGFARFRPDAAAIACRNGFLSAEREARDRRLGLWANDEYVVVDAGKRDAHFVSKGMALVEGVVSGIGDAGGSLYLNFGPRRGVDFAVVIWKRNLEAFERAGLRPRMLTGRRVRVRGLIETRSGPRMEIASPAEIELVDAPSDR